jgi:hypothetical protein
MVNIGCFIIARYFMAAVQHSIPRAWPRSLEQSEPTSRHINMVLTVFELLATPNPKFRSVQSPDARADTWLWLRTWENHRWDRDTHNVTARI